MKIIEQKYKGEMLKIKVDDDVYLKVKDIKLSTARAKRDGNNIHTYFLWTRDGKRHYLHRYVAGALSNSQIVDHIDGDTLNNTSENLRIVSYGENAYNRRKPYNASSSRYKGVRKSGTKYMAEVRKGGIRYSVTGLESEEDAAREYDHISELAFGHFARKNMSVR